MEQITKFQPDRTLYLRGFTGFGAAGALCETSPTDFKLYGVFRDQADFCVLVLYDADNVFEHYSVRYLPDFDVMGVTLKFDMSYRNLQPIDSAKYSWIDWAQMDLIRAGNGEPAQIRLWDHATLRSENYSVASRTFTFSAPAGCTIYDRLTLFVDNAGFDFVANGGETAAQVATFFASQINAYNWSGYKDSSVAVLASADGDGLTLKNARTGIVNVNGTAVSWISGTKFPGIAVGSTIVLNGVEHKVDKLNSPTALTLASASVVNGNCAYLAEYGGADGNGVRPYFVVRPGNVNLSVDQTTGYLTGGNSDDVVWSIGLDFSELGIDSIRQAWMTFAPPLASGRAFQDVEWQATFENWSVTGPGNAVLRCAGPGSVRIGNGDLACHYAGDGWQRLQANNLWRGFAKQTSSPGDQISVSYECAVEHDLYFGTRLTDAGGTVSVSLDGDTANKLECFLNVADGEQVMARRLLRQSIAPGKHSVVITLLEENHQALAAWDKASRGRDLLFDFLEAAVPSLLPDAQVVYPNVSPALDYDTDATYKVSPQRLVWHLNKLGFAGQLNEYIGVYWWNERKRVIDAAALAGRDGWPSATVTVAGNWQPGDSATLTFGDPTNAPFSMLKTVTQWDTSETIADHFVAYINSASVAAWAEVTGAAQFTIRTRTPNWEQQLTTRVTSAAGTVTTTGSLARGSEGTWQIDTQAENTLNYAVRQWHADFYREVAKAGLQVTTGFSMELVNPPEGTSKEEAWVARFRDGTRCDTSTDFAGVLSSQCAPVANVTSFQARAFTEIAALQAAAGLTPWLQFGEFLWWFYSSKKIPAGYVSYTSPISIGTAEAHGFATGDRVTVAGVRGMTSANGTWTITVIDATHFTLDGSAGSGEWIAGSGTVSGGSMAYYDQATADQALQSLGRALHSFTCQDDDPAVNDGADAGFLAEQLHKHVNAIRTEVLSQFPEARFELLYPDDVNHPDCLVDGFSPYPQGGRLNAAVNLPAAWRSKAGSGFQRLKIEALSWSTTYLHGDLAKQAITFNGRSGIVWPNADMAYLVPWFAGGTAWTNEYRLASAWGTGLINFWAYDHLCLMSWPLPLPAPNSRSLLQG